MNINKSSKRALLTFSLIAWLLETNNNLVDYFRSTHDCEDSIYGLEIFNINEQDGEIFLETYSNFFKQ